MHQNSFRKLVDTAGLALASLGQDLKLAVRHLLRQPKLAAVVAITVALGAGANAAIIEAAYASLFQPLRVTDGNSVVAVYGQNRKTGAFASVSAPDFEELSRRSTSMELAGFFRIPSKAAVGASAHDVTVEVVTDNFFSLLDVPPLFGTAGVWTSRHDAWPRLAMLSAEFWRARLGADANIVGKVVTIGRVPFVIAGVMPEGIADHLVGWGQRPSVWIPAMASEGVLPALREGKVFESRDVPLYLLLGRLRSNTTEQTAQAELATLAQDVGARFPATHADWALTVLPSAEARLWPAHRDTLARSFAAFLVGGFALLLLSCTNILLVALQQSIVREREVVLRLALGARRLRLWRQFVLEGLVLVAPGVVLGIGVAWATQRASGLLAQAQGLGALPQSHLSARVVLLCIGLAGIQSLIVGMTPLFLRDAQLSSKIREAGRGNASVGRGRLRLMALGAQIILSCVLLSSAMLVSSAAWTANQTDLGFRIRDIAILRLNSDGLERDPAVQASLLVSALEAVRSQPGVTGATLVSTSPLERTRIGVSVSSAGNEANPLSSEQVVVDEAFFSTLGIGLVEGRGIAKDDLNSGRPTVVVSASLRNRLLGSGAALPATITLKQGQSEPIVATVVGVADDVKYRDIWAQPASTVYLAGFPRLDRASIVMRSDNGTSTYQAALLRRLSGTLPPGVYLDGIESGPERLYQASSLQRASAVFFGVFAIIAAAVTIVGLAWTLSYAIEQKRREVAIRLAIGAPVRAVAVAVLGLILAVSVLSTVLGAVAAYQTAPLLAVHAPGSVNLAVPVSVGVGVVMASLGLLLGGLATIRMSRTSLAVLLK